MAAFRRAADRHPGRACGERHGSAKLTYLEAELIREMHDTGKWSLMQLAIKFRVSKTCVRKVVEFITWTEGYAAPWP